MKPSVKFIHTADLHLGSRLQIDQSYREELNVDYQDAVFNSFRRIVDSAIENSVDFVLIAGDIFDNDSRSVRATRYFVNQAERLKSHNINIYIINGNHDPYRSKGELFKLPKNVKTFSAEEVESYNFTKNNEVIARIIGQSYRGKSERRKMCTFYTAPDQNVYNIGLLHTQLDPSQDYVPVSKNDLLSNKHIDYWALGHIHAKQIINDQIPYIIYSGIPQGRDFGEPGLGGFYLVNLESDNSKIEFKRSANFAYKEIELNLEEMGEDHLSELNNFLIDKLNQFYNSTDSQLEGYILRLNLTGRTNIYDTFAAQEEELISDIIKNISGDFIEKTPFLLVNSIKNNTAKKIDNLDQILKNDPFINKLIKYINKIKSDEKKIEKIKDEMGSIWDPKVDLEKQNLQKFQISDNYLTELINRAKESIIKEIIERRDY